MRKLFLFLCLVLLPSIFVMAQTDVKGVVYDATTQEPLYGVVIRVKDASTGASTGDDGSFLIRVKSTDILVCQYVGYKVKEVTVGTQTPLRIFMEQDANILNEVVVTALGIKRDTRALGYATSTIKGDDIVKAGMTPNPLSSLYGKAAGVGLQATAGGPMGGIQIKIRGAQGLESTSGTRPLFVVDGVPMYDTESSMASRGYDPLNSFDYGSAVNDINSEDIESMEILKGAKASVLYGSMGANGVVLITTKNGAGTRGLGVQVSYSQEWENPYTLIDFQNKFGSGTNQYSMNYEDEAQTIRRVVSSRFNFGPRFDGTPIKFYDGSIRPYQAIENNYMDLFRQGSTSSVSAAISGGNDKGNMRLSYTHFDYNGTMANQGQSKNTLSFNGTMKVSPFADFEFIQNLYSTETTNRRPNMQNMVAFGTFNRDYDINSAINSYKDENGNMYTLAELGNIEGSSWGWPSAFTNTTGLFNLLWNNNENRNIDSRINSITSAKANLKFFPFLTLKLQAGLNYAETEYTKKNKVQRKNSQTGKYEGGQFSFSNEKNLIEQYEAYLFFEKSFMDNDLNIFAFTGPSYMKTTYKSVGVGTMGNFKYPDFWSLTNGDTWPAGYDSRIADYREEAEAMYSYVGQATVSWRNTYFLEFQARNDWTSTLPKQNRSYFYPGASFTWNFSETFDIPKINYGKFRLSWADVGRPANRYYALRSYSMQTLPPPQTNINDITGPGDLFSGDLKPERKREWETGFNLRLFDQSRMEIDFSYYNNTFYNQIMGVPLSAATGAQRIRINAGEIRNEGIEIFLKGSPIATDFFRWELSLTAAHQWDQIVKLYPGITQINQTVNGIDNRAEEGKRMGNLWLQDYVRDKDGNKVVTANGLYQISTDPKDQINVGSINPDVFGGFSSNFYFQGDWGMANLMLGFDYRFGGKMLSFSNYYLKGNGLTKETLKYRDAANGGLAWTENLSDGSTRPRNDGLILPGVKADGTPNDIVIPAYNYYSSFIHDMSNGWQPDEIKDNHYVKFREMALAYTFPKRVTEVLRLQKLTLSLTARNLFYIYKSIKNIDAEAVLGTGSNNWVENSNYPSSRSFGFRVNMSF